MRKFTRLALTVTAAAMTITALGAPVGAADTKGTLAIVNGHPATKIDICIGSKEMSSKLGYGGVFRKNVISTGGKVIKFYKSDPRTCKGKLLAKKWIGITPGSDLTIVLTKNAPKVLVYDNESSPFLGEIPPRGAPWFNGTGRWINASEMVVNWHMKYYSQQGDNPYTPSALDPWSKGDQYSTNGWVTNLFHIVYATKLGSSDPLVSRMMLIEPSRRYEVILIGSHFGNLKMVLLNRGISQIS